MEGHSGPNIFIFVDECCVNVNLCVKLFVYKQTLVLCCCAPARTQVRGLKVVGRFVRQNEGRKEIAVRVLILGKTWMQQIHNWSLNVILSCVAASLV